MSHLYLAIPLKKYNTYKGYEIGRWIWGYTGSNGSKSCFANTLEGLYKAIDNNTK